MSAEHLDEDEPFAKYLDDLLTIAKLGNTDVERITGIGNRTIQKWRKGIAKPTIPLLRQFADGMKMSRAVVFVRAGVLHPEDLDLDRLYIDIAEAVERLPAERRTEKRSHLSIFVQIAQRQLDEGIDGKQSPTRDVA